MSLVIFCKRIVAMIESGIYNFWIEESLYLNNDALRLGLIEPIGHPAHSSETKVLKLSHLLGNYIILVSGLILSIIALAIEINFKYSEKRKTSLFKQQVSFKFK